MSSERPQGSVKVESQHTYVVPHLLFPEHAIWSGPRQDRYGSFTNRTSHGVARIHLRGIEDRKLDRLLFTHANKRVV